MRSMIAVLLLAVANRATAGKKPNVLVILAGECSTSIVWNGEASRILYSQMHCPFHCSTILRR